ncbi:MAG: hypothetical protein ACOYL6_02365 [Bacteriovoracaceae bacterium]
MNTKLFSKILGLLAVCALVSACGKNAESMGSGSSAFFSPLSGPGVSSTVTGLQSSLSNVSMSNGLYPGNPFYTREYTPNNGSWLGGLITYSTGYSYVSGSELLTYFVQSVDANQVLTSAGTVTRDQIMNKIFRPDLNSAVISGCSSPNIVQATTSGSSYQVSVNFVIACNGGTSFKYRTHIVDTSYPLIMNPIQEIEVTQNGSITRLKVTSTNPNR